MISQDKDRMLRAETRAVRARQSAIGSLWVVHVHVSTGWHRLKLL